ncbi:MAG TPA: type II toxin-antitoxin system HicA family toxin [Saprospiraceae bacterium]|nr:type II toxin-antitoxin system HicA family toxin [Saprospiraceae bacterium]
MSRFVRIVARIKSGGGTVTYSDLKHVLNKLGYVEQKTGKTSGSRVAFYQDELIHLIRLHKPHPGNELKQYQIKLIKEELEEKKLI